VQEPSQPANERRYAVYRAYDAQGALLYVGMTERLDKRLQLHRSKALWWPQMARLSCEFYETYGVAFNVERHEILDLDPVHNQIRRHPLETPPEPPAKKPAVQAPSDHPRLLTTPQCARELRVHPTTIQRWIRERGIRPTLVTSGGHSRWDLEDLKRQLRELHELSDPDED
jgi:hypothetical protein